MLFEKCCSNTGKQHCCWLHPLKFNIIHLTIKFWKRRFFLANHHFQLNHAKLWGGRKWGFFVPTTSGSWTAGTVSFCCIQREWNLDHRAAIDPCFRCHFFFEFDDVVEAFKQKPMMLETLLGFKISLNIFQTIWSYWIFQKQKGAKKKLLNYSKSQHLYTMFCFQKKNNAKNYLEKKNTETSGCQPRLTTPPTDSSSGIVEDEVLAVRGCLKPSRVSTVMCSEKPTRKMRKPEKLLGNSKIES